MSIWSSIFGHKHGEAAAVEIRPSGLLMDADGWYYEESLDAECPHRTIRVQQDRPGNWYVRNTNCKIAELNDPARAADVLEFFTGSFRWLRFEREAGGRNGCESIRIIGTFLGRDGTEREIHLGHVEQAVAEGLIDDKVENLWGRIRCIRPPGSGRRPNFCLRYDLLVELEEGVFGDDVDVDARLEDLLPATH